MKPETVWEPNFPFALKPFALTSQIGLIKFGSQWIPSKLRLCLLCGSGCALHVIWCNDCGECYHKYCLNRCHGLPRLDDVASLAAWRCYNCTGEKFPEASRCRQPDDEPAKHKAPSRILTCEDESEASRTSRPDKRFFGNQMKQSRSPSVQMRRPSCLLPKKLLQRARPNFKPSLLTTTGVKLDLNEMRASFSQYLHDNATESILPTRENLLEFLLLMFRDPGPRKPLRESEQRLREVRELRSPVLGDQSNDRRTQRNEMNKRLESETMRVGPVVKEEVIEDCDHDFSKTKEVDETVDSSSDTIVFDSIESKLILREEHFEISREHDKSLVNSLSVEPTTMLEINSPRNGAEVIDLTRTEPITISDNASESVEILNVDEYPSMGTVDYSTFRDCRTDDVCDPRQCALCSKRGDFQMRGRLLALKDDEWVHSTCALWSSNVVEKDSVLFGVPQALSRARYQVCSFCNLNGASLPCIAPRCSHTFHAICALQANSRFTRTGSDKWIHCYKHASNSMDSTSQRTAVETLIEAKLVLAEGSHQSRPTVNYRERGTIESQCEVDQNSPSIYQYIFKLPVELFQAPRSLRLASAAASMHKTLDSENEAAFPTRYRLGALTVCALGRIVTSCDHFHTEAVLYPLGFVANRMFWSCSRLFDDEIRASASENVPAIRHPLFRQCLYTLRIVDDGICRPLFRIECSDDPNHPIVSYHPDLAFARLVNKINEMRRKFSTTTYTLKKALRGEYFFGFGLPEVAQLLERIPATQYCRNYAKKFSFSIRIPKKLYLLVAGGLDLNTDFELPVNSEGCARLQEFLPMTQKSKERYLDAFKFNSINAFRLPKELVPTKPKDLLDSKLRKRLSLKQQLQEGYGEMVRKNRTGLRIQVLRSAIEGWGVYAKQYIKKGEVIVEYVGELIDDALADLREAYYNRKGIGCYMFRITDSTRIVDATMKGSIARFINHSCYPNAKTDSIFIGEDPKIIIYSMRDIGPGEEITYDYMFDGEEELVPCYCGSKYCKGYMNIG